MKPTPVADEAVMLINNAVIAYESTLNYDEYFFDEPALMIAEFEGYVNSVKNLKIESLKAEFWAHCEHYEDFAKLKKVYDVRFKRLLNWRYQCFDDFVKNRSDIINGIKEFLIYYEKEQELEDFSRKDKNAIEKNIRNLTRILASLSHVVRDMLEEFEAMSPVSPELISKQLLDRNTIELSCKFKLASKRKTDFIKILSAMYDANMFVNEVGKLATNKQEVMNAFGTLLNDDFSSYSSFLAQAKAKDDKTYMKTFETLTKKGWDYLNSLKEEN